MSGDSKKNPIMPTTGKAVGANYTYRGTRLFLTPPYKMPLLHSKLSTEYKNWGHRYSPVMRSRVINPVGLIRKRNKEPFNNKTFQTMSDIVEQNDAFQKEIDEWNRNGALRENRKYIIPDQNPNSSGVAITGAGKKRKKKKVPSNRPPPQSNIVDENPIVESENVIDPLPPFLPSPSFSGGGICSWAETFLQS